MKKEHKSCNTCEWSYIDKESNEYICELIPLIVTDDTEVCSAYVRDEN